MRISKIMVPLSETQKVHLKEINLTKRPLGSTVALVGKNGAGKSRILKFVEEYVKKVTSDKFFEEHFHNIPSSIIGPFKKNIENAKSYFQQIKNLNSNSPERRQLEAQINTQVGALFQRFNKLGQAYVKMVDNDDLKNIKENINNNTLSFEHILANLHFDNLVANPDLIQGGNNAQQHASILINEFTILNNQSTIAYFTGLTNKLLTTEVNLYLENKENPGVIKEKIKDEIHYKLFNKFQQYTTQFLGKDFSYRQTTKGNTVNSVLHFNGEPFNLSQLSPGQKTLFAYAILFFLLDTNSKTNIRESIIIIDEPEKHLHPGAQLILINALKSIVGKTGQLWIATHSIHILSHLDYDEILMVKDDQILAPSRTTPGNSFNDLMGIDEHIDELVTFIHSISEWAYGNFMVQCFKTPEVVFGTSINDPQFRLFKEFITQSSIINLLDYGAGKGRIGYTLKEDEVVSNKIAYSAFEPDKIHFELLNNIPDKKEIFSETNEIPLDRFDCVILCNVLHEIHPREWVNTLNLIKNLLTEEGFLLVVEDRFLPKGENAHEFGYLIFGSEEIKKLMNSQTSMDLKLNEEEFKDRIVFNAFRKSEINPTSKSVMESIQMLNNNSFNNIKLLKKLDKTLYQGRRYANETQLYINSQLAIEYFSSNN